MTRAEILQAIADCDDLTLHKLASVLSPGKLKSGIEAHERRQYAVFQVAATILAQMENLSPETTDITAAMRYSVEQAAFMLHCVEELEAHGGS